MYFPIRLIYSKCYLFIEYFQLKFQKPLWDLGHACRETLPGNRKLIYDGSKSRNPFEVRPPNDSQVGAQFTWLTLFVDIYGYTVRYR